MAYRHYVPQLHMRNFGINEKQVARFDKMTGKKKEVSIGSFCGEEDYFAFDSESLVGLPAYLQWIHQDLIENLLSSKIEGPVSCILKTLIAEKTLKAISESDVRMLLEWAAWMFIANPQSIALSSIEAVVNQYRDIDYAKLSKTKRLKFFLDLHEQIVPIFQKRGWVLQIIDPKHGYLLSCDRPVMIVGKSLQELPELLNQTIIFPISPQLALIGDNNPVWGYASNPLESTKSASLRINILTLDQAYRFVFGADMSHIDDLFSVLSDESKL